MHEGDDAQLQAIDSSSPCVTCTQHGSTQRIDCEYTGGCDGVRGDSRHLVPASAIFEKVYPLGWRGVMCGTTPCSEIPRAKSASFCAGFQAFTNIEPQRNPGHGAKGLSLVVWDVYYLSRALNTRYAKRRDQHLLESE